MQEERKEPKVTREDESVPWLPKARRVDQPVLLEERHELGVDNLTCL